MKKEVDAVTKLYDFILYMIPKLEKFPRNQKFLLGDRIETALLERYKGYLVRLKAAGIDPSGRTSRDAPICA
jgi:hypothetical protein